MAAWLIPIFSHSDFTVITLSIVILVPIFIFKIAYIQFKINNAGSQLIALKNTYYEEHNLRINLIIAIVGAIIITLLMSRAGIPWLIVTVLIVLDELYMSRFIKKGLKENGFFTGHHYIEWDKVESFKWNKKSKEYSTLKIGHTKFYSYEIASLKVIDDQKEEVNDLFKRMVSNYPQNANDR